jgi:hypothetical protein
MKLPVVLAVLIGTLVLACSTAAPAPVEPTPNIDATVVAGVKGTQEAKSVIEATVEARVKEELQSQPTQTPATVAALEATVLPPTPESASTPTPAPTSAATPVPTQTLTPSTQDGTLNTTSYVLIIEPASSKNEVTFKIGNTAAPQTIQALYDGTITKLDLSIDVQNPEIGDFEQITGGIDGSNGIWPPQIIIGTASVGGRLAPENTVITAWQNDGEDLVGATVVKNKPDEYTGDLTTSLSPLGDNLINVMGFDNEAKEWTFYDPRTSLVAFSSIKTMHDNFAYYLNVTQSQTVSLDGFPYRLHKGLNVVPWGEYKSASRLAIIPKDGLSLLIQDENLVRIWRFNNEDQNWSFFDPRDAFVDVNTLRTLNDNEVIWLKVKQDVDTTINGAVLDLHGYSHRTTDSYGSNLIVWRHGPLDSSKDPTPPTPTPTPDVLGLPPGRGVITVWPASGLPGARIDIVGTGFTPNSVIEAGSNDCQVSGITLAGKCEKGSHPRTLVSSAGEFVLSYTVPMNSVANASGALLELKVTDSGGTVGSCPCFNLIVAEPTPLTPTLYPTATPQPSRSTSFGDGTWVIGNDIQAGTYRSSKTGSGCYWERLSGFSGELDDIIANGVTDAIWVVEISSTDAGFSTERCGTWTEATSATTSSLTSPFGDGMFLVGMDISPGTWKSPGGDYCYWARLSGFSGELGHIKANGAGGSNNILTIEPADKGFESSNCGIWTKTG